MHAARSSGLGISMLAALRGRRLTGTNLGQAMQRRAQEKHCITRAEWLLVSHDICIKDALCLYGTEPLAQRAEDASREAALGQVALGVWAKPHNSEAHIARNKPTR
jgi:hypothetical protein